MFTTDNLPSQEVYINAFASLLDLFTEEDKQILAFHYSRPQYRMTAQDLRDEMNYVAIAVANRRYGEIAKKLAKRLNFDTRYPEYKRPDRWKVLATRDTSGRNATWILRPQVIAALEYHKLVDTKSILANQVEDVDIHEAIFSAVEGKSQLILHLQRERNHAIVAYKKQTAESLACEICGFLFADVYGEAAQSYCEVHHLLPLSKINGQQKTELTDLMIVCANCHRIIHLKNPPYSPDEIRKMLGKVQ